MCVKYVIFATAEESLEKPVKHVFLPNEKIKNGAFRIDKHSKKRRFRLRDPRKTRVLLCFGRRKPAPECSLVAKRHVFYGFSEAILGFRDDLRKPLYFTLKN